MKYTDEYWEKRISPEDESMRVERRRKRIKILGLVALILCVGLGLGNWFTHLPTETRAKFGIFEPILEDIGLLTADWTDALGLTGTDASITYVTTVKEGPLPFGVPQVVNKDLVPTDFQILYRKGYWVAWSPSLRVPLWSAYAVPVEKLVEHAGDRPSKFKRDNQAKRSTVHEDYTKSGYDRGHMAPNHVIATRYGREAQLETFLMSNIVPQLPDLNRNAWRLLEEKVAHDLSELGEKIWVITGIVPGEASSKLPNSSVHIPKGFYKVIASVREGKLYALGVYLPQETSKSKNPRYCFRSIDAIEALSGMDFFTDLPKERQAALESVEATRFWSKGWFN
jgi:endonuclease G